MVNGGIAGSSFILEEEGHDGLLTHHPGRGFMDHLNFHIVGAPVEGMFGRGMDLHLRGSVLRAIHIFNGSEGSAVGVFLLEFNAEHIGVIHHFNSVFFNIIVIKLCILFKRLKGMTADVNRALFVAFAATAMPVLPVGLVVPVTGAIGTRQGHQHYRMDNLVECFHLDRFGFLAFEADGFLGAAGPFIGFFLRLSTEHPKFDAFGDFEAIGKSQFGAVLHETESNSS